MALKKATNTAQAVKSVVFEWNYNDTMVNTLGGTVDFGVTNVAAVAGTPDADSVFVIGYVPKGAVIVGGAVTRDQAFDTAGYDISIGDLDDNDEYLTLTDLKAAGVTALVPTGLPCNTANQCAIVLVFANDDVCTAGKAKVRVDYVVPGRSDEVTQPGA